MLTSLTVKNFRNLRSVTLERLGRLTLIGGKNGVGKTALLEALWLLSGPDLPELSARINVLRGFPTLSPDTVFHDIFCYYDTQKRITITANGDWGNLPRKLEIYLQRRQHIDAIHSNVLEGSGVELMTRPQDQGEFELLFEYHHSNRKKYVSRAWWVSEQLMPVGPGPVPGLINEGIRQERQPVNDRPSSTFIAAVYREDIQSVAAKLGKVQLSGEESKILSLINPMEPTLKGLTTITIRNTPVIHAYIEGIRRPMPVQLLGEGLNRMLGLALSMNEASGGLILIDEIENGLYHRVQEEVFSTLLNLAEEFDVQIFATTHSGECIRAAHRALAKQDCQNKEAFVFHRLDRIEGEIEVASYDNEMLDTAEEFNMETR